MNQIRVKGYVKSIDKQQILNSNNSYNYKFKIFQPTLKKTTFISFRDVAKGKKNYDYLESIKEDSLIEAHGTIQQCSYAGVNFKVKWIWIGHTNNLSLNNKIQKNNIDLQKLRKATKLIPQKNEINKKKLKM